MRRSDGECTSDKSVETSDKSREVPSSPTSIFSQPGVYPEDLPWIDKLPIPIVERHVPPPPSVWVVAWVIAFGMALVCACIASEVHVTQQGRINGLLTDRSALMTENYELSILVAGLSSENDMLRAEMDILEGHSFMDPDDRKYMSTEGDHGEQNDAPSPHMDNMATGEGSCKDFGSDFLPLIARAPAPAPEAMWRARARHDRATSRLDNLASNHPRAMRREEPATTADKLVCSPCGLCASHAFEQQMRDCASARLWKATAHPLERLHPGAWLHALRREQHACRPPPPLRVKQASKTRILAWALLLTLG